MARPRKHLHPVDNPASIAAVIAAQVAGLRRARGWSQTDLAKKVGFSTSVMQQFETGSRGVTVEDLTRLAFELDVSPAELVSASFLDIKSVPLFGGRRFPRRDVRAWAAGEPGAALRGMDERRYDQQMSADDYLARKRVAGLEDVQATVNQLRRAAAKGSEDEIDDCLRALEAQVRHVRNSFGRKRGSARVRPRGSGSNVVETSTA